jgi:hypothetical protein
MRTLLLLARDDQVAVALRDIAPQEAIALPDGRTVVAGTKIPFGFKVAVRPIEAGEKVRKYNVPIGTATRPIAAGEVVHLDNLRSDYIATLRERT